jgi:integrase
MDAVKQMLGDEFKEELEDGKVLLFSRNGIFQARFYKGNRQYIYKSLKTKKVDEARKLAVRYLHEMEFKQKEGLPLQHKSFNDVIDEYIALRQSQYIKSLDAKVNSSTQQLTSIHMLRQIKRVSKFWKEYCGTTAVMNVDNSVLQDYVGWRKDYYHKMPVEKRPKNHKLNPTDKTLEWELTLAKMLLKFADDKGYRGKTQLPTYRFKAANAIVRPTFTVEEYWEIIKGMRRSIKETNNAERKYTKLLLRDYVLILANSGMRVGEANNLKDKDVAEFVDEKGRRNFMFYVNGKTGRRIVIPRTSVVRYVERVRERNLERKNEGEMRKVRSPQRKKSDTDGWFFSMYDGNRIVTLIDQFNALLKSIGLEENRYKEKYTLYSLRHFYAVMMIRRGIPIFDLARNMGTSVQIIEKYYGKQATTKELATKLGG